MSDADDKSKNILDTNIAFPDDKLDQSESTTRKLLLEPSKTQAIIDRPLAEVPTKRTQKTFCKLPLLYSLYSLLLFQILALIIYLLWTFFSPKIASENPNGPGE